MLQTAYFSAPRRPRQETLLPQTSESPAAAPSVTARSSAALGHGNIESVGVNSNPWATLKGSMLHDFQGNKIYIYGLLSRVIIISPPLA